MDVSNIARLNPSLPQVPVSPVNKAGQVHPNIAELNVPPAKKHQLNFIFKHLTSTHREVTTHQADNIIDLILTMTEKHRLSAQTSLLVLDLAYKGLSGEMSRLEQYGLVLCPDIVAIVEKRFQQKFNEFFRFNMVNLCFRYLSGK